MGFIARLNFPTNIPPCRAYVHTAGFEEVYSGEISKAADYLFSIVNDPGYKSFRKSDFLLAALWGSAGNKMGDLFDLSDIGPEKEWPGNPDVSPWVLKNGFYFQDDQIICGDTLIMLGREEEFRRKTSGLEEYCQRYPDLGDMEPVKNLKYVVGQGGSYQLVSECTQRDVVRE